MPLPLSTIGHASLIYSLTIFTAGLILGCIRMPIIEPLLGPRYAQLLEMPLMFLVVRQAAGVAVGELHRHVVWVMTRDTKKQLDGLLYLPITFSAFLTGLLALVQFLAVEVGLYLVFNRGRGKTGWDWIGEMDWVVRIFFVSILGMVPLLPVWLC